MAGEVRVHELEGEGCGERCKERSPHGFVGEVVGDLVEVEGGRVEMVRSEGEGG